MTPLLAFAHSFLFAEIEYSTSTSGNPPGPIFWICWAAFMIFIIASMWILFTKAGQPGWASIIPIYNTYILCKIAGRPGWWVLLMFIPFVNFVIWIIVAIDIAGNFGKGTGFGVGVALLSFIFIPILAFGSARYQGAATEA